jgi:hypothetical protein
MPHGHPEGWRPEEIGVFVDQHLKRGVAMPKITETKRDAAEVTVAFASDSPVTGAALHYTTDTGNWKARKWETVAVQIDGNQIKTTLPGNRPLVYFLTITDHRKLTVSTEHETIEK